ncbi:MAG: GNAT family N-acetyltransferase [Rhodospirillaceae bacterium]|nr:GNAT family N-acetyltransferase [Rhodospirillaceae bacterium]
MRIRNVGWRAANQADLQEIKALSERAHPGLPEDIGVFAERLRLYPDGVLVCREGDRLEGYAISHPWRRDSAPSLNASIGAIPEDADTYYIHDFALDASARGHGLGSRGIAILKAHARKAGFRTINLVAVNASGGFWESHGFRPRHIDSLARKLATYGTDATYMECGDF